MSFLLTLNIANVLPECFTIDFEQLYFSLYERNYLPALASKAWSKQTFKIDKVRGAILNVFLICSSLVSEDTLKGFICRVCGLRLGPNFVVRLAADKNFYLRLTVEKMLAFAVFNNKYIRPYGCSDTNFTATNFTNPKSKILSEMIETNHWNTSFIPLLVTNFFVHSLQ